MKSKGDQPGQLTFGMICETTITKTADGSFVVKPGKPLMTLTPKQFAAQFHPISVDTVYRWKNEGLIPEEFICPISEHRYTIDARAVEVVRHKLKVIHEAA